MGSASTRDRQDPRRNVHADHPANSAHALRQLHDRLTRTTPDIQDGLSRNWGQGIYRDKTER